MRLSDRVAEILRRRKKRKDPEDETVLELESLLDIELPGMDNRRVQVPVTIASNSVSYIIPYKVEVRCVNKSENHSCKEEGEMEIELIDYPLFVDIPSYTSDKILFKLCNTAETKTKVGFETDCKLTIDKKYKTTIKKLRARPVARNLLSKDNKIYDQATGKEWKALDIFLLEQRQLGYDNDTAVIKNRFFTQPGKICLVEGRVLADPKNARTSLMVDSAKELIEGVADLEEMNRLQTELARQGDRVAERMHWLVDNYAEFAHVIHRDNIIYATMLCHFTPLYLRFNNETIKGWAKILAIGDSTVAKSKTARAGTIDLIGLGQVITGEMASMAGIAAANTQGTSGQWVVEYGPLVLQDGKILVIDGAQKINPSEWAAINETERRGVLTVMKAGKAEANARTRLLLIFNPLSSDGSSGGNRQLTRSMDSFRYAAQSLETVQDSTGIARADFCAFVSAGDVTAEQVHKLQSDNYDERIKCLTSLCRHVWSGSYRAVFTEEATNKILSEATRLYDKFYVPKIQLVSMDIDKKLARLSAATAAMTCNFSEDWRTLTITEKHVEYVVTLIEQEYEAAGLDALAKEDRQEITKEEAEQICLHLKVALGGKKAATALDDYDSTGLKLVYEIVNWISLRSSFMREDIRNKFNLVEKDELRPLLSQLDDERLVKRTNRGIVPLPKLIKLARLIPNADSRTAG